MMCGPTLGPLPLGLPELDVADDGTVREVVIDAPALVNP